MNRKTCKKKKKKLHFNLAKVYALVIFDSCQFARVYSSRHVRHLVIRQSLCEKFREFFSSRKFLLAKVSAPKVVVLGVPKKIFYVEERGLASCSNNGGYRHMHCTVF